MRFPFPMMLMGLTICATLGPRMQHSGEDGQILIGKWASQDGKSTMSFDQTHQCYRGDGSKFSWSYSKGLLVVNTGTVNSMLPLVFTRDGNEFSLITEGGARRTPFFRLSKVGKRMGHANRSSSIYLPDPLGVGKPAQIAMKPSDSDEEKSRLRWPAESSGAHAFESEAIGAAAKNMVTRVEIAPDAPTQDSKEPIVKVGPNVQVSSALSRLPHGEVVIAADPRNPKRLLAASMFEVRSESKLPRVVLYSSDDGGATWRISLRKSAPADQSFADPTIYWSESGQAYFASMHFRHMIDMKSEVTEVEVSPDGGRTWIETGADIHGEDRPFLGGQYDSKAAREAVYCSVGVPDRCVFVSYNHAKTFRPLSRYWKLSDAAIYSGNPVVLSDGSLLHFFERFPSKNNAKTVDDDVQGVRSALGAIVPHTLLAARLPVKGTQAEHVCSLGSFAAPEGFLYGLPELTADNGRSQYRGRAYAVWTQFQNGKCVIAESTSRNGGLEWSKPIVVSEQRSPDSYWSFMPSVAVNKNGVIAIGWYDTRQVGTRTSGWDYRLTVSRDGGQTWGRSVRVSSHSSTKLKNGSNFKNEEDALEGVVPGHTAGMTADAMGLFHPIWTDNRTGVRQVFTSTVRAIIVPKSGRGPRGIGRLLGAHRVP